MRKNFREIWQMLKEEIQLKANTNPSGSQQVFCDQFLACSEPRIKMDNQEEHVKIFLYACAILQNLGTIRADPGRFLLPFKLLQNVLSQELYQFDLLEYYFSQSWSVLASMERSLGSSPLSSIASPTSLPTSGVFRWMPIL